MDRVSEAALANASSLLKYQNQSVLDIMLSYQSPAAIAAFLKKINSEQALTVMLARDNLSPTIMQKIADFILHEKTWQDAGLLEKLFKYAGDKLCKNCCDAWVQGKVIPLPVLEKMQAHLKTKNPLSDVEKIIQSLSMAVDEKDHKHANDSKSQPVTITTGKGRVVALNEFELQSIVWEEGLKSYHDLHVLAGSDIDMAKHAMKSANILLKSNLLFTGSSMRYGDYQKYISLKENRIPSGRNQETNRIKSNRDQNHCS